MYVNDASFPDNCRDKSLQSCHIGDYDVIVSSVLNSGFREDILYGGGGRNTFNNNDDGELDQLFVLSDYHSHNQPTGRLHNGANADTISSLGEEDRITILGATTDELSIRQLNDGLGIFASGSLEAIVTDSSWSAAALGSNVFGDASRFW